MKTSENICLVFKCIDIAHVDQVVIRAVGVCCLSQLHRFICSVHMYKCSKLIAEHVKYVQRFQNVSVQNLFKKKLFVIIYKLENANF